MMRMKTGRNKAQHKGGGSSTACGGAVNELEMRPGGMLVQKRTEAEQNLVPPPPTIRVQVKYGSVNHHIYISSQATFGELKKMLTGPTGLHHQDQKLYYKDKERDSNAFLDTVGVKDKSKIVLVEDTIGKEKRLFEMKKIAKIERDKKLMSEITLEVDRLARQVAAFEPVITRGEKVVEEDILNLIELLMNQFLKLDGIVGDNDVKLQKKMQAMRVQKCVETLDMLKIKNSVSKPTQQQKVYSSKFVKPLSQQHIKQNNYSNPSISTTVEQPKVMFSSKESFEQPLDSGPVVFTTQWVTFDSTPPQNPFACLLNKHNKSDATKFIWDLI